MSTVTFRFSIQCKKLTDDAIEHATIDLRRYSTKRVLNAVAVDYYATDEVLNGKVVDVFR